METVKSTLLKASAGSGKTTRLTEEVLKRISTGGKFISALTFTRAAMTEMRFRIMGKIAEAKDQPLLERLRLIMEAGRVGYSTIDSFFYRLYAAAGFAPKLADEQAQMELEREIEILFRDRVLQAGKADTLIMASRILRTDIDTLQAALADDRTQERFLPDRERLDDLGDLMKQNGVLRNRLSSLYARAEALKDEVSPRTGSWVIDALADDHHFIGKAVAKYTDLEDYQSLGKKINWKEEPYSELNRIFSDYRETAEQLAVNRALLRELSVAFLGEIYLEAAAAVKAEQGLIFFNDVRRGLLEMDGLAAIERPRLMSNYFSLGLDRMEHLLIDEFQDTSKGDIDILMPLIDEILSGDAESTARTFFAVGDWKQMIYGWRGADREALESAIEKFIVNGEITESSLEYNFRSTPLLISFFNELVGHLFGGKEKTELQRPPDAAKPYDGVTEVNCVELEKEGNSEAPFYPAIVDELKKKKDEYGCLWGEMAVLALTNNQVQKIETELVRSGIGVATVKGRQLLSTAEGVAVMFFLAAVLAREEKNEIVAAVADSPLWKDTFGNIRDIRAQFAEKFPRPHGLLATSCAIEYLRGKLPAAVLDIWQEEAQRFYDEGGAGVDDFLSRIFNVRFNVKVPEAEDSDNIKVDTIHGTKGLQFRHVFVFWNEDEKETPFCLESQKCHVQFSRAEIDFISAGRSATVRDIIQNHEVHLTRLRREKANVFYVAATRAERTLTVFLPKTKSENKKPVHQAVLDTFERLAPEGRRKEASSSPGKPAKLQPVTKNLPVRPQDEPEKYAEIDPALVSADIRAGILRGDRLHRWLAKVTGRDVLPPPGELNDEEYEAAVRFVQRDDVSSVMFRTGRTYIEQPISDTENSGIVDRMIVSDDLITIMDYKSGSMKGLRRQYEEQLKRYTKIMQALYPLRKVEYYILTIDV